MALSAPSAYYFSVGKLRKVCADRRLNCEGPVRTLRQWLVECVKGNKMDPSGDVKGAE
jgi:hypothetical protein